MAVSCSSAVSTGGPTTTEAHELMLPSTSGSTPAQPQRKHAPHTTQCMGPAVQIYIPYGIFSLRIAACIVAGVLQKVKSVVRPQVDCCQVHISNQQRLYTEAPLHQPASPHC